MSGWAPDLKNLPSKADFYDKFSTASNECSLSEGWPADWENKLGNELNKHQGLNSFKSKIMDAYCYAYKKRKNNSSDSESCYFYYYWMMDKILGGLYAHEKLDFLIKFYQAVDSTPSGNKCEVKYKKFNEDTFKHMREIYDFTYDHDTIQMYAEHYGRTEKSEYLTYLQGIGAACTMVNADCQNEEYSYGDYCNWFNSKVKDDYCEKKLPALRAQLASSSKAEQGPNPDEADREDSLDSDDDDSDQNVDKLPSKIAYGELSNKKGKCQNDSAVPTEIRTLWTTHTELTSTMDGPENYWCYTQKGGKDTLSTEERCHFLYYFIGDIVFGDLGSDKFQGFMNTVCDELKKLPIGNECDIVCTKANYDYFKYEKEVYDYHQDKATIERKLGRSGNSCNANYREYLGTAEEAYKIISGQCNLKKFNELDPTYCNKFNTQYKQYMEKDRLKLKCTSTLRNPNEAGSSGCVSISAGGTVEGADTEDPILRKVPSKIAYGEIEKLTKGRDCCKDDNSFPPEIGNALGKGNEEYTEALKKVWCFASKGDGREGSNLTEDERCGFLYYWFGDKISDDDELSDELFWKVMETVRGQLQNLPNKKNKCDIVSSHIEKKNFNDEKKVYNYYKDHGTIQAELNQSNGRCSQELDEYLTQAKTAYMVIGEQCTGELNNKQTYCTKFSSDYKKKNPEDFIKSKCLAAKELITQTHVRTQHTNAQERAKKDIAPTSTSLGNALVAVPTVFTTVGLPVVAFFLYKVYNYNYNCPLQLQL
ncbi:KIR protein [Plasmodium coatneyi]|uniref:KIR protein n=1 Tax=Plasmodium coatneyi TaxID=208452 RepID=A0A1B1E7B0_9APIC|nr:KIR protein [Plasmodium coatneyi]ANQ10895.1 KIR protein [Plasmodium coatneyi]